MPNGLPPTRRPGTTPPAHVEIPELITEGATVMYRVAYRKAWRDSARAYVNDEKGVVRLLEAKLGSTHYGGETDELSRDDLDKLFLACRESIRDIVEFFGESIEARAPADRRKELRESFATELDAIKQDFENP